MMVMLPVRFSCRSRYTSGEGSPGGSIVLLAVCIDYFVSSQITCASALIRFIRAVR